MMKSSKKIKTILMLPCMCSIAFYMGSQVVTYTEAAFVNETKIHSTVSTAIVFPKTIDTLVKETQQHENLILNGTEGMNKETQADSVEVLEQKAQQWREQFEKVKVEREALQHIYTEIEDYYKQSVENVRVNNSDSSKQVLQYVQAGFTKVGSIKDNVDKQISVQKMEEFILTLQKRIEEKKAQQVNNTSGKAEQEQVVPSSEQKESNSQEEIKQPSNPKQEQVVPSSGQKESNSQEEIKQPSNPKQEQVVPSPEQKKSNKQEEIKQPSNPKQEQVNQAQ
ncbi:DUF4047 domain-containing protein [Bacillus cereus]|nr:DUF4047 domain-containing protein [Bacillus cereus]